MQGKIKVLLAIAAAAALCILPFVTDSYVQYIVNLVLVYVVVTLGLNLVMGFAGQVSFGSAAFMGIGAFATALLNHRLEVPFLIALPMGAIGTGILGYLVGLPAVRVRGLYLALLTIAFLFFTSWALIHWSSVTMGSSGVRMPAVRLFGWDVVSDHRKYFVLLPICLLMIGLAQYIVRSKWGRAFLMVRDAELAAQSNGINLMHTKAFAFGLSAAFSAVGGGMFALTIGFVVPTSFGLLQQITQFAMALIGGFGSIAGSVIGAALLTVLPEVLRELPGAEEVIYGILIVVFVVFMPEGVAGWLQRRGWIARTAYVGRQREVLKDRPMKVRGRPAASAAALVHESPKRAG
jgi:branched-chain amino acid transport system permease protein